MDFGGGDHDTAMQMGALHDGGDGMALDLVIMTVVIMRA